MLRWRGWSVVAACWAALFAVVHFYWGLGGSLGLATSAGEELADERPAWFVAGGLWGVGVLLLAGTGLAVALARERSTGRRRRRLLLLGGAGVGVLLLARAIGVHVLLLSGALDGNAAIGPDQRYWALVLWNPWFAVGGLAFALSAAALWRRGRAARPD
ncbi:DUF3995 domain-containing protein [Blastococcus goldschmidtiae]|uniref:DUF3995 domain-containing protein n=1 Tax=Blastococcus goldschmidtiae TaxID=3075546 RepID=A0ABU2K3R2_9ACTN|nr:DUF3995 domain-containing protein [Blastococcus sp. DSM 46792]MDT0274828.1 DUF3995 domain-containing protein [Blastococcus sp. DSM 46792]